MFNIFHAWLHSRSRVAFGFAISLEPIAGNGKEIGVHVWRTWFHISKRVKMTHCLIMKSARERKILAAVIAKYVRTNTWNVVWDPEEHLLLCGYLWFVYILSACKLIAGQKTPHAQATNNSITLERMTLAITLSSRISEKEMQSYLRNELRPYFRNDLLLQFVTSTMIDYNAFLFQAYNLVLSCFPSTSTSKTQPCQIKKGKA